jgi:hypothetical protein
LPERVFFTGSSQAKFWVFSEALSGMVSVGKNYYENPKTLYFMGMFGKRMIIKLFSRSTDTPSPQSFSNHEASAHPCASRCLSIGILSSPHLYYGNGN